MSNNGKNKVGENSSGEVVNQFWSCRDLSDIVPLYTPKGLYLKPIAKINVSVNLPQLKTPGKTISTWEVMEKIRTLIRPDEFASLKVAKSTLEFIRLEGDLTDRCRLQRVIARLDHQRLNLIGFSNILKVRAAEAKDEFPMRHTWDSYFRDAKHMNELKPGERPDTIHITGLPVKWFTDDGESQVPSESLVAKVFKKWGILRRIDVPAADAYRSRMRLGTKMNTFSYEDGIFFDAYIQYIEYMDFVRAMDALRGMKLLKKEAKNCLTACIKVDFDKTKHMSDSSVAHREFERKRLIAHDALAADKLRRKEEAEAKQKEEQRKKMEADETAKESRRKYREEKRKRKALTVFRKQEEDKVSLKIAREEQKLIKAQRQLESIRLLDELFDRIKLKVERKEINVDQAKNSEKTDNDKDEKRSTNDKSNTNDVKKSEKKSKKSKKKKMKKEKKKKSKHKKEHNSDKSEHSSEESVEEGGKKKLKSVLTTNVTQPSSSNGGMPYPEMYTKLPHPWYYDGSLPMMYGPPMRGMSRGGSANRFGRGRGRGDYYDSSLSMMYGGIRGGSRGGWRGGARHFNPHIYNEQYYKYFASLTGQDLHGFDSDFDRSPKSHSGNRRSRSSSRSRSRSRSRRRTRSRTRSKSRNRNRSRSRSRGRSRSKSRSKRRSHNRSRSATRSRSGSRSRKRSRKSHSRSKSRSHSRRSRSRSKSNASRSYNRSRKRRSSSRVKITRAKSRSRSARRKSRSSSWSLPKTPDRRSCSWSKTVDDGTNSVGEKKAPPEADKNSSADVNNVKNNPPLSSQTETITPD